MFSNVFDTCYNSYFDICVTDRQTELRWLRRVKSSSCFRA